MVDKRPTLSFAYDNTIKNKKVVVYFRGRNGTTITSHKPLVFQWAFYLEAPYIYLGGILLEQYYFCKF